MTSARNNPEHPAIALMRPIADRMIRCYREDFTKHDVNALARMEPIDGFIWYVRPTGTWLFCAASQAECVNRGCIPSVRPPHEAGEEIWYWSGKTLRQIDQNHAHTMLREWADKARDARRSRGAA